MLQALVIGWIIRIFGMVNNCMHNYRKYLLLLNLSTRRVSVGTKKFTTDFSSKYAFSIQHFLVIQVISSTVQDCVFSDLHGFSRWSFILISLT